MAGAAVNDDRSLEETPTWAVAGVTLAFILVSLIVELGIHRTGLWLLARNKKALYVALDKVKSELMVLGFISLLLTVAQDVIAKICLPKHIANSMLPCTKPATQHHKQLQHYSSGMFLTESLTRRNLAGSLNNSYCTNKGKYPLISQSGMHQLHIFIFVLAILHVVFSFITIALGQAKMSRWNVWEHETKSVEYIYAVDPERYRLTRQTTFIKDHANSRWSKISLQNWIVCFFRQFYPSVNKTDYLTLRYGFIKAHMATNPNFNFRKYIKRQLENDFSIVVGISFPLWAFAVVFLLLNVYGWDSYFWLSFVPLVIVLLTGMKLEHIITEMALEIQEKQVIIRGLPTVHPSDKWFWFNRPKLILYLVHFTVFENAFQISYFLWIWSNFGLQSCFHKKYYMIIVKIVIGTILQVICSYITLPLYALVTQMGSKMQTGVVIESEAIVALKRWHGRSKDKDLRRTRSKDDFSLASTLTSKHKRELSSTPPTSSPLPFLRYIERKDSDIEMGASSSSMPAIKSCLHSPQNSEASTPSPFATRQLPYSKMTESTSPRFFI